MTIKAEQKLAASAMSVKPITTAPIDIDFFNGNKYEGRDGIEYPGYSAVVIGSISKNQEDDNYISEEEFAKWAIDAYYDVDAYVNKAMSVLGMFNEMPNFQAIPVITKDHMMRAIAAKIEQNLWTNPSNAETRVTLTQSSGGRTTNTPSRENFNPSDLLNEKVREYINGSNIFEVLADSFEAIVLDRNEYYTKDEIDAIISSGNVPVEVLYTKNVGSYFPIEPGDGVNKKYVDAGDKELQDQINGLTVGNPVLKTDNVTAVNPSVESYTGVAIDQNEINIENAAITRITNEQVKALSKRVGTPLMGYKTRGQKINTDLTTIVDWDTVKQGTVDSLEGFDPATGLYTIQLPNKGDLMAFDIQFKVSGNPLQGFNSGTAYLYKNGAPMIHPVYETPIESTFVLPTTSQVLVSLGANDLVIRDAGTDGDEVKVGDVFEIKIQQSTISGNSGIDLLVSDFRWDLVYKRAISEDILANTTDRVKVSNPAIESLSNTATNQAIVNAENKTEIELQGNLITGLQTQIDTNASSIADNTTALSNKVDTIQFEFITGQLEDQIESNDADIVSLNTIKADITYVDEQDERLQTQVDGLAQAIGDAGTWTGEVAKEYVDAGDAALQVQIDNLESNAAQLIVDDVANLLMPVGTIMIAAAAPLTGTWEDLGELLDGQSIIGGVSSDGEVKSHKHNIEQIKEQISIFTSGFVNNPVTLHKYTYDDVEYFDRGEDNIETYSSTLNFDKNLSYTTTDGDTYNRAWGIGIGTGLHIWKRTA